MTILLAMIISLASISAGCLGCYFFLLRPIEEELKRLHLLFSDVNKTSSDSIERVIRRLDDLELLDPDDIDDDDDDETPDPPRSDFHSGDVGHKVDLFPEHYTFTYDTSGTCVARVVQQKKTQDDA